MATQIKKVHAMRLSSNLFFFAAFLLVCSCKANEPDEMQVQAAIEEALLNVGYGASVNLLNFRNFPSETAGYGRTSVEGIFALSQDLYADNNLSVLNAALRPFDLEDSEVKQIAESFGYSLYPQYSSSPSAEWRVVFPAGTAVTFAGELMYTETASDFNFQTSLDFIRPPGRFDIPDFAFVIGTPEHDRFVEQIVGVARSRLEALQLGRAQSEEDLANFSSFFSNNLWMRERFEDSSLFVPFLDNIQCNEAGRSAKDDEQVFWLEFRCSVETRTQGRCGNVNYDPGETREMWFRVTLPYDRRNPITLDNYLLGIDGPRYDTEVEGDWYECNNFEWRDEQFVGRIASWNTMPMNFLLGPQN